MQVASRGMITTIHLLSRLSRRLLWQLTILGLRRWFRALSTQFLYIREL
jgi:hypothetical protein